MACKHCTDPDGESCFPYYGLAPHIHYKPDGSEWQPGDDYPIYRMVTVDEADFPENFELDPNSDGECGTYTHCLKCSGKA